ncbi:DUF397 domain-containing protein [Streptomyces sp. SPB074]|uniref:DUF397 domain-containing protein n=1 Tax=Streptomyces sp. (strain SPB074) TaxID=465543 RepID=UPI00017F20BB|nr:DUF397 domain-containing protein [Streptomyces sp. SPB074]EDY44891.1 conserved hypothetical protein [Streptomyces sp. SPB074]
MTASPPSSGLPSANWFKSSYSNAANNCVEAAFLPGGLALRDSKDTSLTPLRYTTSQWAAFCDGIVSGAL